MSRDSTRRLGCGEILGDLELYAEGELRDRAVLASVRGHLAECRACRDRLHEHDALTRAILSGSTSCSPRYLSPETALEEDERVDRIMDRILALPLRQRPARPDLVPAPGALSPGRAFETASDPDRAREYRPRGSWPRACARWAGIAAASLVCGLIFQIVVALGTRSPARRPAPISGADVTLASATEGEPRSATGGLHWLLEEEAHGAGRVPRGPFRLYGLRRAEAADPRDGTGGDDLEWLVHARAANPVRPTRKPRIFLVAESGSREAPLEIDPVTWSSFTASGGALPVDRGGPSYQVYVLEPTNLLETPPPATLPARHDGIGGLLPVLDGGARLPAHRWVTPASLRY